MSIFQIYIDNDFGGGSKYIRLTNAIKKAIEKGELKKNDQLPSLTEFMQNLDLGKETILKAIQILKDDGLIVSAHGKGFYVEKTSWNRKFRLFVLFDEFSAYKRNLYHSMLNGLKMKGEIQLFFHHYNPNVFQKLITDNLGHFTHYVIMPFPNKQIGKTLAMIPRDKLFILDRNEIIPESVPAVYQNHELDVYNGLCSIKDRLTRYSSIVLVFPQKMNHPRSIISGFNRACQDLSIKGELVEGVSASKMTQEQLWFVLEDDDLVSVVEHAQHKNWQLGKDLGILSYNETSMKRIAAGGIATLSVDFAEMGLEMIQMILSGKDDRFRCIGKINNRASL